MTSTSQINQWFEMYVHLVLFIKLCIHCINLCIINHFLLNINSLPKVIKTVMKKKLQKLPSAYSNSWWDFKACQLNERHWQVVPKVSVLFQTIRQCSFLDPIIPLHGSRSLKGTYDSKWAWYILCWKLLIYQCIFKLNNCV